MRVAVGRIIAIDARFHAVETDLIVRCLDPLADIELVVAARRS